MPKIPGETEIFVRMGSSGPPKDTAEERGAFFGRGAAQPTALTGLQQER
jgi:hypothetical protein